MFRRCQQFKISREGLREIDPGCLNSFFRRIAPDEQFRFISFQHTDFQLQNLTYLLFSYVPHIVHVTVERPSFLDAAFVELTELNPGVGWQCSQLVFFDPLNNSHHYVRADLKLTSIPMRISSKGVLICK